MKVLNIGVWIQKVNIKTASFPVMKMIPWHFYILNVGFSKRLITNGGQEEKYKATIPLILWHKNIKSNMYIYMNYSWVKNCSINMLVFQDKIFCSSVICWSHQEWIMYLDLNGMKSFMQVHVHYKCIWNVIGLYYCFYSKKYSFKMLFNQSSK